MLKVLLVEDDLDLATALIDYMQLEGIECDFAADGLVGYNLITSYQYDVIILDLNLPKIAGLDVCRRIREQGIETPVLMLTARDTLDDKLQGFHHGADDYLVKPFAMQELMVRMLVLSKRRSGQATKLRIGELELDLSLRKARRYGQELKLSPISIKILELLMREYPSVVTREKIIQMIWGEAQPDSNSLKVHMFNLRKQIDQEGWPAMVQTVPGFGFSIQQQDNDETTP
ncbi:response regulator transcription factor [Vibrio cincinnatiensis]|jgi:DNA-binding response OmpR family regulator|uniref:DNA-binding response regulator, OmpR family, contains REC and winged-helix (WHTH) domain n=1 Tax=Vibrio cincinnatiensis DSM 19608 TaxID=1123491 RepID=A0A1T4L1M0_VIBCI|nr:response regulator transcription factor [Vibrio cincinnatiensis]MCG3722571.1 response regulator transcription factor [Vibrio cincinnatiensis]MCG3725503.1 response regulator transcription factor [Vibrio cincinnatiensis]MCG3733456.1 response regulator transcription factor [Vibrio cincinnatiensis]MCG3736061.1 response regulator transcription factor [Vibrio cincinnatiensis]MCG3739922.1 response regulator transcription factor [Vibrio cincinnatiensis]